MFIRSLLPARARERRAHYLFAAGLFAILGFHVGVWAVQLASLSAGLGLDPAALGAAITVAATAGLVTLFAGGTLADRVGQRPGRGEIGLAWNGAGSCRAGARQATRHQVFLGGAGVRRRERAGQRWLTRR